MFDIGIIKTTHGYSQHNMKRKKIMKCSLTFTHRKHQRIFTSNILRVPVPVDRDHSIQHSVRLRTSSRSNRFNVSVLVDACGNLRIEMFVILRNYEQTESFAKTTMRIFRVRFSNRKLTDNGKNYL